MVLKRLRLEDFRRFTTAEMKFARRLNVIVGVNGAGKSSILSAIATLLTWYVRRLVSPNGQGAGASIAERDIRATCPLSSIGLTVVDGEKDISWTLNKGIKGAPIFDIKSDLKELGEYVRMLREDKLESVPVIVAYTVNRSVIDIPLRIKKHHVFSVLSAYDDAFDRAANFRRFFEWFRENEDVENERIADTVMMGGVPHFVNNELAAVRRALSQFLPEFSGWKIRRTPLRMEVTKEGIPLSVEQLSDGEKCMIALVGDLARRLIVANPGMEDPLQGNGVVLIDEIELHLHPEWQRRVLPRLLQTFPHFQFAVTTHSPLVLAQLNAVLYQKTEGVAVFCLRSGEITTLQDPETGLIVSSEMDDAVRAVDEEFDALLNGEYQ